VGLALSGCASASNSTHPGGPIRVVAAESCWGSIAKQLGGQHVRVTSLASSPDADPHDYEPTVEDARAVAGCQIVLYNGVGYDTWIQRLLAASPNESRIELDVGRTAEVTTGDNPHLWYSPHVVREVIAAVTEAYKKADPDHAAYFDQQRQKYERTSLAEYDGLISAIASEYAGTPVGASESIALPLAEALKLKVVTPAGFTSAISQGIDPRASDKAMVDQQIQSKAIAIFIYNKQNSSPDVMTLVAAARGKGIPVVTVTETPEPSTATFQAWQVAQLRRIEGALRQAKGR
jgi:zinc/manganese transport system substrate-binding protein